MALQIIITGASGRMGSTLIRLVQEAQDLTLVGAVDPKLDHIRSLAADGIAIAQDLADIIKKFPSAVIIDFTAPAASLHHAQLVAEHGNSLIIGTTGLTDADKESLAALAKKTRIFQSPNMSIGISVLLELLPRLTAMLGDAYDTELLEIHHNRKKDAPSGTALRLAEALAEGKGWTLDNCANYHREGIIGERPHQEIGVQSLRGGDVVGVHTVYYMGPGERIEITHQAHSRENFAGGALRAARWLAAQPAGKLYSMHDVLMADKN